MTVFNSNFVRNFDEIATLLDCPASVVGTSTVNDATMSPYMRKSFYANGRFWVFYSDGTNMVYYTSTDGITWVVGGNSPVRAANSGQLFSIWFDGTYLHYANGFASSIYYRRGTPNSNGTITWSAVEQTVLTTYNNARYLSISVNSNGYVWVAYTDYDGINYYPCVIKSGNKDGTWGTSTITQLSATSSASWTCSIVPLTSSKMLAVYYYNNITVRAKRWDGSVWGTERATTSKAFWASHSVVAEGDDVHLAFINVTTSDIIYVKYTYSSDAFGAETIIQVTVTGSSDPVLSLDTSTNDLYVFWAGYPTAHHIYYRRYAASTGTWETRVDWIDESVETLTAANNKLTCFYNDYAGYIGLVYMTLAATPWNVKFDFLTRGATRPKGTMASHAKLVGII